MKNRISPAPGSYYGGRAFILAKIAMALGTIYLSADIKKDSLSAVFDQGCEKAQHARFRSLRSDKAMLTRLSSGAWP